MSPLEVFFESWGALLVQGFLSISDEVFWTEHILVLASCLNSDWKDVHTFHAIDKLPLNSYIYKLNVQYANTVCKCLTCLFLCL